MNYLKRILLFSSPRSGSTLLANIIRSHPSICFFNEIFTRAPALLPNFEKAFHHAGTEKWRIAFEHDLKQLEKYKLMWGHGFIHCNKLLKTSVFLTFKVINSLRTRLQKHEDRWAFSDKMYHINSLHQPPFVPFYRTQFVKVEKRTSLFIKDIRMHKAYSAFKHIYPEAYFIYLVRDPYFQVASHLRQKSYEEIIKWVDPDHLKKTFLSPHLVDRFFLRTPEQTFALLWLLENEWIYQDMINSSLKHLLILRFEQLVLHINEQVKDIFGFLELDYHQQTEKFLEVLRNFKGSQTHNRSIFVGGTSTDRVMRPSLTNVQLENIEAVLKSSNLIKHLGYDGCYS